MDSKELLGLLTARVQRFHLAPGGIPKLTSEDIAHALGMIQNDQARIFARVKYCGQFEYSEGLAWAIRSPMLTRAMNEEWRIHRPGFLLSMAYMMLAEAVDPMTCTWCGGRAELKPDLGPVIVCGACKGSGRKKMRDTDKAKLLDISRQSWNNTWERRYRDAQAETVDKWEDIVSGALRKRIGA